ncbi:MAG: TonB-dependent receptor plug domain-containing protein [Gammaproteobacteria bacterium]
MNLHDSLAVRLTLAASLCLALSPLLAAPDDTLLSELAGEDYFLAQVPVVLSATRLAQPQYATPVAVSVIDRAMIEASGALDIPDLLRLVPGFQVAHAKGHTVSATYHGLADEHARRMQVLVDGRPVYGPALGGVRWTDLPLDIKDVERIEVVRGPNAAAYGANAFLGAINIITQHPAQVTGSELTLLGGNKEIYKGLLRHGAQHGDLGYRMTLGYRHFEGFQTRTDLGPADTYTGNRFPRKPLDDGMRVSLFNLRGDYRLSDQGTLEFQAGYNGGPRREGNFDDLVDAPREREVSSHFQQLVWRHTRAAEEELRVQVYHTYMRHRSQTEALLSDIAEVPPAMIGLAFPGYTDELIVTDFGTVEQRFEIEAQHSLRLSPTTRAVWGGSARLDRVSGPDWFGRDDWIENQLYRLFGNLEWQAYAQGTVNLGGMLEDSHQVGRQFSPRLALNHQLSTHHGLRAAVSRALRLPTLYEDRVDAAVRFADGTVIDNYYLGNPELKPESMLSYELGYLGRFPAQSLTVDIKAFHDTLENRITGAKRYPYPDFNEVTIFHSNDGRLMVNGIEAALTYRPDRRRMLGVNWAYARGKGLALDDYCSPDFNPIGCDPPLGGIWEYEDLAENVPTHTFSVFAMQRFPGQMDISGTYYRVSQMNWLGDGDRLADQDRLDLRVAKHFPAGATRNTLALVMQNVLGEYQEFRAENVFDTRVYVELTLALP